MPTIYDVADRAGVSIATVSRVLNGSNGVSAEVRARMLTSVLPRLASSRLDTRHRLLSLAEPPTAIHAASDTQAIGVLSAARQRGLSVPDDLALPGFDDIEIAECIGLSTIGQPLKESGRLAVEHLLRQLAVPGRPVQNIDVPLTLKERLTT